MHRVLERISAWTQTVSAAVGSVCAEVKTTKKMTSVVSIIRGKYGLNTVKMEYCYFQ